MNSIEQDRIVLLERTLRRYRRRPSEDGDATCVACGGATCLPGCPIAIALEENAGLPEGWEIALTFGRGQDRVYWSRRSIVDVEGTRFVCQVRADLRFEVWRVAVNHASRPVLLAEGRGTSFEKAAAAAEEACR